jgi:RNA polymerase sigma factor (sigma-70 family)
MKEASSGQEARETFFSLATEHLDGLYAFVRRQLAYYQSLGDLLPGELEPEDVVDAVILRAYRTFSKELAGPDLGDRLIRLAADQLRKEVRRLKFERERSVHLEEDIPETPPEEESLTLGEEILEFYQPDEDLKLEDIFPDYKVPTPDEAVEMKEELLRCVNAALAAMPKEWRRAFRLRHAEGLTEEDIAENLEKTLPEIRRILRVAAERLKDKLIEAGCGFEPTE